MTNTYLHLYFGHIELHVLWADFLQLLVMDVCICKSQSIIIELRLNDWTTLKKEERSNIIPSAAGSPIVLTFVFTTNQHLHQRTSTIGMYTKNHKYHKDKLGSI